MCGIAGYIDLGQDFHNTESLLEDFTKKLSHRGPNSHGKWIENNIGLCHTRLSILDLSKSGSQPMIAKSGRYVIVFNGEIYNHLTLRDELNELNPSISWSGHSDTETILQCLELFGLEKSLKKFTGMFALAVWDRSKKELSLARDRFGEKPLYFGKVNNSFIFTSELKVLDALPNFHKDISHDAIELYFRFGYIPEPHSIYKNIHKLSPGSFLRLSLNQINNQEFIPEMYWELDEVIKFGLNNQITDPSILKEQFSKLLEDSVRSQLISDVPIGCFLSGGIDSSLITSVMQSVSNQPIKTFTIGFNESEYDESHFAREISKHLGTDHNELIVTPKESMDVIPLLPEIYDEPFSDSSQIPTFLVSKLAKTQVTVSLSGDGGDELFGGYNRYLYTKKFWNKISAIPFSARKLIAIIIKNLPINSLRELH